jgi:hypothetical protein
MFYSYYLHGFRTFRCHLMSLGTGSHRSHSSAHVCSYALGERNSCQYDEIAKVRSSEELQKAIPNTIFSRLNQLSVM